MSQPWDGGNQPPAGGYGAYPTGSGGYGAPPTGGSGGYGGYPPPSGYGASPPPPNPARNTAIAALIVNIIAATFCCGITSVGGLICAALAMGKADTEPETARTLTMWAWILLGATFLIDVIIVIVFIVAPSVFLAFFAGIAGSSGDY